MSIGGAGSGRTDMGVGKELIAFFEQASGRLPTPRVRALHLPPADRVAGKDGEFCALELDDGSLGLGFVLLGDTLQRLSESPDRLGLVGADAMAVARRFLEPAGIGRTLGFTAVAALTRRLFDKAGYVPPGSADSVGMMRPEAGDHVGMVGHFTPLVPRVVAAGARLTVVELRADLAGEKDGYRVTLDPAELAGCNKVLATSSILLNDTLDRILACCGNAKNIAVVGPGAGCLPDPLFARGVTFIGGNWILDPAGFIDALRCGRAWTGVARKSAIGPRDYPGFDALLART